MSIALVCISIGLCKPHVLLCKAFTLYKKNQIGVKEMRYDALESTDVFQGKDKFWGVMNCVLHPWMPQQGSVLLIQLCVYGLLKKAFHFFTAV